MSPGAAAQLMPDPPAELIAIRSLRDLAGHGHYRVPRLTARVLEAPLAVLATLAPDGSGGLQCWAWPADGPGAPVELPQLEVLFRRVVDARGAVYLDRMPGRESALPGALVLGQRVAAFAGAPVVCPTGEVMGCLCAITGESRQWSEADRAALQELAASAAVEVQHHHLLRAQAAQLLFLLDNAEGPAALVDAAGRVVRVNERFTRVLGYAQPEVQGHLLSEIVAPPAGAGPGSVERVARHRSGSAVRLVAAVVPLPQQPAPASTLVAFREPARSRQEALFGNDQRFRALIEHSTDVIAIVSPGGAVDYVSASVERSLGHPVQSLLGRSVFTLVHPDDAPGVIDAFARVLRGEACGESRRFRAAHADGSWRTLEVRGNNLLSDPAVGGVVVNARDITDERQATQTQRRLNAFLEATPDFVAIFDPHGRALSVNRAFRAAVALSEDDDLSSVTIADLYPPAATEVILQEGIPTAVREGVWSGETVLQRADGRNLPISQVILAHKSDAGTVEFLSTLARDITAQKEADAALRRSEAHFRSLIENALDIITVTNATGDVVFASPSVHRVLGYAPDELIGRSLLDLVHPESQEAVHDAFARSLQTPGLTEPLEARFRHRDGSWRVLETVSESLLEDPSVAGVVLNSRDVTERHAAEAALRDSQDQLLQSQKMEAIGRLAGGVAHDFNNLLTAIKGFTELLLLDFDERDPRRAFITEIQGAANRAAGLTRQLLAFSRKQVLQPRVIDMNGTVSTMEKMLRRLIGEDLVLRTVPSPRPVRVKADPGQMEQVLLNLVVNARDAMPNGGELTIATEVVDLRSGRPGLIPGAYVALSVTDTGVGMDEATRLRVFEPFFTTKGPGKGTGLGLSTVYGIVQQSGGAVEVESEPGRGTTFRVLLPRVDGEVERPPVQPSRGRTDGSETVLLVEDEMAVRVLVRRVLDRAGYRVLEASSGAGALAVLAQQKDPVDLLLTDVIMPGMSGPELAAELAPRYPDLKVLYMSGYTDEAIVHHGVLDPGVSFVEKPFTPDVLLRKLREVLDSARAVG